MLLESLSDHAAEQLKRSEDRWHQASTEASASQRQSELAFAELDSARRTKARWKRLLRVTTQQEWDAESRWLDAVHRGEQAQARKHELEQTIGQQAAGADGEQAYARWLASHVPDDWHGFGGYRNRKGEADLVVVGPSGVWVVEVKNRNARLFVDGDTWRYDKLDRWGNVVTHGRAVDNSGRTWGQQASQVAEALEGWLTKQGQRVPVHSAVMLVHRRATLATVRNPGVDLVDTDPEQLRRRLIAAPQVADARVRSTVAGLIRRDHEFHSKPRPRRSRT